MFQNKITDSHASIRKLYLTLSISQINTMRSVCLSNSESYDNYFSDFLQSARARLVHSCHFPLFEGNEFGLFFEYSNVCLLKSRLSKQSFWWHQLDLHKSQFYNSHTTGKCYKKPWVVFSMVIMQNPIVKTIDGKAELLTWMVFRYKPWMGNNWKTPCFLFKNH